MLIKQYTYIYIYIYIQGLRPLPPAPFWQQATVDWLTTENWFFFTWNCYFGDLEAPFWVPGTPFWWSRDPRGHPTGTWRSRCAFLLILGSFGESLGIHFGHLFVNFQWFWVPEWETGSRSMFLVVQGWKWCQIAEAACAISIVKLMCLNGFTFSTFSLNWCPEDGFRCLFSDFWWIEGTFFWFLRVLETGLKFDDF